MDKGSYCLILLSDGTDIPVGALGVVHFPQGWYVYCGSAQGPGGLTRVSRHIRVHKEGMASPRWHIDYILGSNAFRLIAAISAPDQEREYECRIAALLSGKQHAGFGCSDCSCHSHLFFYRQDPTGEVLSAFSSLGLDATIQTINKS
jgi:Uri superfamily endonuclease